jgi:hypothetical protein
MAAARVSTLPELVRYGIRPTLVEARLISDKHANDAAYISALSEQLRDIERNIAALEESLRLHSSSGEVPGSIHESSGERTPDINWIRTKSSQLCSRLRRIEETSCRTQ